MEAYLPRGIWYDLQNRGERYVMEDGAYVELDAPLDKIPVLVRGGSIFPRKPTANTTTERSDSFFSYTRFQNFV